MPKWFTLDVAFNIVVVVVVALCGCENQLSQGQASAQTPSRPTCPSCPHRPARNAAAEPKHFFAADLEPIANC